MEKSTSKPRFWSAEVTKRSNALDLEPGVFTWKDPRKIAESLKHPAGESMRRWQNAASSVSSSARQDECKDPSKGFFIFSTFPLRKRC